MIFKLKTSKKTMEIFDSINSSQGLQPYILSKLAIALSIRRGNLLDNDFSTDNNGLELNRQTIFGEHDLLFKVLITMIETREVSEDEYFPKLVKAHLDRGAILLENETRYGMNFYDNLTQLDMNI